MDMWDRNGHARICICLDVRTGKNRRTHDKHGVIDSLSFSFKIVTEKIRFDTNCTEPSASRRLWCMHVCMCICMHVHVLRKDSVFMCVCVCVWDGWMGTRCAFTNILTHMLHVHARLAYMYISMYAILARTYGLCMPHARLLGERGFGIGCSCSFRLRC
jgi:hypothetical protein